MKSRKIRVCKRRKERSYPSQLLGSVGARIAGGRDLGSLPERNRRIEESEEGLVTEGGLGN